MKKYISSFIFIFFLFASIHVQGGSGAGGAITFINETEEEMHIIWSAAGCAGMVADMLFVCEREFVPKHENRNYKYNWGVTDTWIHVGLNKQHNHPCADGESRNEDCKFAHFKVHTRAWKTDLCTLKKSKSNKYSLICKK